MRLPKIVPRDAPIPPYECELVEVDTAAIPFMLSALAHKAQRFYWFDEDQATAGRQLLAKQAAGLLMGCTDRIVGAIDRLYMLTDTIHNGAEYFVTGNGTPQAPYVYNPPIPLVPVRLPGAEPSTKFSLEKTMRLVDNLANATTYADAPDVRNVRQQLEELIAAIQQQQSLDPEILAKLEQIAELVA